MNRDVLLNWFMGIMGTAVSGGALVKAFGWLSSSRARNAEITDHYADTASQLVKDMREDYERLREENKDLRNRVLALEMRDDAKTQALAAYARWVAEVSETLRLLEPPTNISPPPVYPEGA